jgi:hypothetical protein
VIRHGGGSFGSTSYFFLEPDVRTGIVLLANDADSSTESTLAAMASDIGGKIANSSMRNTAIGPGASGD